MTDHLKGCLAAYNIEGDHRPCTCNDTVPYLPVPIAPDSARDARVAARRAADARRAGAALDRLIGPDPLRDAYARGWRDGYAASEEQHNRDYGVPCQGDMGCRPESYCPARSHWWQDIDNAPNAHYGVPGERYNCAGCSFATVDIGRMTEHCVATGHRQRAFGDSTDKAPNAHYGAPWERCPKRHASESQHLLDCGPTPTNRYTDSGPTSPIRPGRTPEDR